MILLLLACATPRWTAEGAMGAHLAALDADKDGRVDAAEYGRARWAGPEFAQVDGDGDGAMSAVELLDLYDAQSPTAFDGGAPQEPARMGAQAWAMPAGQPYVWEVLAWMADALGRAGHATPPADVVAAAVASGDLHSPESLRALACIAPEWRAAGWTWPEGLPTPPAPDAALAAPDADPSAAVTAEVRAHLEMLRTGHRPAP